MGEVFAADAPATVDVYCFQSAGVDRFPDRSFSDSRLCCRLGGTHPLSLWFRWGRFFGSGNGLSPLEFSYPKCVEGAVDVWVFAAVLDSVFVQACVTVEPCRYSSADDHDWAVQPMNEVLGRAHDPTAVHEITPFLYSRYVFPAQ